MKKIQFLLLLLAPAFSSIANIVSPKSRIPNPVAASAMLIQTPEVSKALQAAPLAPPAIALAKVEYNKASDLKSCYKPASIGLHNYSALNLERKMSNTSNKVIYKDHTLTIYAQQHFYTITSTAAAITEKH